MSDSKGSTARGLEASLKLTSGRVVKMREINGDDELSAMAEADSIAGGSEGKHRVALQWASQKRALVSIDGVAYDQSANTAETFRAEFSAKERMGINVLFNQIHGVEEEEFKGFRSAIQWEASS